MKRRSTLLWGAIGATLIGLSTGSDAWSKDNWKRHESWNWSGTLSSGKTFEINGINGNIVAEPGTGNRVVVTAEKKGRRDDPSLVEIKVQQDSDGIVICAVYPGQSSPCRPLRWGRRESANDVSVDFHVTLPAGASFEANNVNGGVRVHGLRGHVKARTVNGACAIETAGSGQASTVNGAVRASIGRLRPDDELAFKTVNGSITVTLPANIDAEVSGTTVNGSIHSDFPITVHGSWGPRSASGTIGRGGARLKAQTVNGAIRYERQDAL